MIFYNMKRQRHSSTHENTLSLRIVPSGTKFTLRLTACVSLSTEAQQGFSLGTCHAAFVRANNIYLPPTHLLIISATYPHCACIVCTVKNTASDFLLLLTFFVNNEADHHHYG